MKDLDKYKLGEGVLQSPIYINLSGDYTIPEGNPPVAGSITGDLRLHELDAFLAVLRSSLQDKDNTALQAKAYSFISEIAAYANQKITSTMEVEITSKFNPKRSELVYSFKFKLGK